MGGESLSVGLTKAPASRLISPRLILRYEPLVKLLSGTLQKQKPICRSTVFRLNRQSRRSKLLDLPHATYELAIDQHGSDSESIDAAIEAAQRF